MRNMSVINGNSVHLLVRDAIKHRALFLMLLPALIVLLINDYLPMFGLIIAFKNINFTDGILGSPWSGFNNFKFLFTTNDIWVITRNTVLYNLSFIFLNSVLGVIVAVILYEIRNKLLSRIYQTIMFFPYFLSMIVIAFVVFGFLSTDNGFVNKGILRSMGIEPVMWYAEAKYWPFILITINTWKVLGYYSVIYLATIIGIDKEMYESALIDGAGKWRQFISITLPNLVPMLTVMTLLQVSRMFYADFGLFYQVPMESGVLFPVTNVIDTYAYRALMNLGDIGMASAAGFFQSVMSFACILGANAAVKAYNRENSLF